MQKVYYLIGLVSALILSACVHDENIPEVTLSLSPTILQMKVGEMATIEASGTATAIEWTSSDESVATVYYGVVTAKALGTATITARSGKVSVTVPVYVSGTDGATLRIVPAAATVVKGQSFQFKGTTSYELDLIWSSSDESIVSVDQTGKVVAHKAGNAQISLTNGLESVTAWVFVPHNWGEYQLVWSDEFNGTALDESVWTIQTGGNGWGNNELQYYTTRQENVRVEDGNLVIEARKEAYENREYTSGRIMSKGKKDFLYGKLEARISLPSGGGLWPAFWTLGKSGTWPGCGEIDIMEFVGNNPGRILGTLHTNNDRYGSKSSRAYYMDNIVDTYHVYGVEWAQEEENGKDVIRFYVDGNVYSTQVESVIDNYDYWPFNQPNYFIINMAVGGNLGGQVNDDIWGTPRLMKVDWVRVYQRSEK